MSDSNPDRHAVCARCGDAIDLADSFEVRSEEQHGRALLCRLEHVVAWCLRGAQWQFERPWEVEEDARAARGTVMLVRHRQGVELVQRFASVDELRQWSSRGGFWAT